MMRFSLIAAAGLLLCTSTSAQEADTTLRLWPEDGPVPVGFDRPQRGRVLSDSIPALNPDIDLAGLLATTPGSFTYLFDRPGWPDGWSAFGLSPNARPLTLNDIPFTQLFTGRPAYNLLPFTFLDRPRLEPLRHGAPYGVNTRLRSFVSPLPLTEGTYWRGGDGIQSVDVVHAQHRRRALFGNPGFMNVMGSYSGRASDVVYAGSDLTRGRRVQLRLRFEQRAWSIELLNLHNRRRVGAHSGVIVPPGNFNAIYRGELAAVEHPEAERRIIRNDFTGTLRRRFLAAGPTSVTAYWTAESFRYRDDTDTLLVGSDRTGMHVRQPLAASADHRLDVYFEGWTDRTAPIGHFQAPPRRRSHLHAYAVDSLRVAGAWAALQAGWAHYGAGGGPAAALTVGGGAGFLEWMAELSTSRSPAAAAYETGFGSLQGLPNVEPGRAYTARAEATLRRGPLTATLGLFGQRAAFPVDVFASGSSHAVRQAATPLRQAGAWTVLGWRSDAERGLYLTLQPTAAKIFDRDDSVLLDRVADTLPAAFGRARLGARYAIFQGDLDFDLYVDAVAWSGFSSRELHPQTGLLAVPDAPSIELGANHMLNVAAEVFVRGATLFLVYDNVLSGTTLLPGNLIVPIYPLPAQRFRFGVYWPIFG